ncbi:hypothetical protein AB1L88_25825 [Tautonia sp. JC769]|uniref:hypothetical protein n=1 Tax=Tautonia sp. JC769 TaxID=3232135 RepID=UPI003458A9A0
MNKTFLISCVVSMAAVLAGSLMVAMFGYDPPKRLLVLELALFSAAALLLGFGAASPNLPGWARSKAVHGAACVVLGVAAIYVPASFIVSACFIGVGTRLVWSAACELERMPGASRRVFPIRVLTSKNGIVPYGGNPPCPAERPEPAFPEKKP